MTRFVMVNSEGELVSVINSADPPEPIAGCTVELLSETTELPHVPLLHSLLWPSLTLVDKRSPEYFAEAARSLRNQKLAACDWVITRALDQGGQVPKEWQVYRKALRDITTQPGFPSEVTWPVPPAG